MLGGSAQRRRRRQRLRQLLRLLRLLQLRLLLRLLLLRRRMALRSGRGERDPGGALGERESRREKCEGEEREREPSLLHSSQRPRNWSASLFSASLTWRIEKREVLSFCFSFIRSLACVCKDYNKKKKKNQGARGGRRGKLWGCETCAEACRGQDSNVEANTALTVTFSVFL